MKLTKTSVGISALGLILASAILAVHFVAHAQEKHGPAVRVDSKPINREPGLGTSYSPVVKKVAPSVVTISSTRFVKQRLYRNPMMADPFFRQFFGDQSPDNGREVTSRDNWLGSGIIVTPDGYILTANHVVEGADEIKVGIQNDKTEYSAKVIGMDPPTDVAILKIEAKHLPAVMLGDSDQLEVGDVVLAVGNPFGIGQTVTRGIISALGRSLSVPGELTQFGQTRYQNFIQTDASINKGNSGGALVDAEGRLIGINDAIVSPSGTSAGIGFAVPINMARGVMEGFLNGGKVARGYLGVDPQDIDAGLAQGFKLTTQGGTLVADVGPDSPAAKAGLLSGDVIVSVNGKEVSGVENFRLVVSQLLPGSQATLKIVRNGLEKTLVATVGERPDGVAVNNENHNSVSENLHADMLDGVTVADIEPEIRQQLRVPGNLQGALVSDLDGGSNSADAGLQRGDIIVEINHQPVANANDAVRVCKAAKGDQILLKIWRHLGRQGATRYLSVDNAKRTK
jgi:serine protease Do